MVPSQEICGDREQSLRAHNPKKVTTGNHYRQSNCGSLTCGVVGRTDWEEKIKKHGYISTPKAAKQGSEFPPKGLPKSFKHLWLFWGWHPPSRGFPPNIFRDTYRLSLGCRDSPKKWVETPAFFHFPPGLPECFGLKKMPFEKRPDWRKP